MIKMLRLDERLIHGQIAIKWSRVTGVNRIIVGNDMAASSEIIQKSLLMAAPATCKTVIKSMDDTIKLLNDPRMAGVDALVLVRNPDDMIRVLNEAPGIEKANIGNFGRVEAENPGYKRQRFGSNLYADELEIPKFQAIAKKCHELGIPCFYQTTPDETAEDLGKLVG